MVSLKAVRASNAAFKESKQSVVALFVGATAGIGMSTLQNLAKTAYKPRIYVVGRSKSAAAPLMNGLNASNPEGTFIFIESEISLMKRVDEVCDEIKSKEKKLDLLFISPGNIDFGGRNESSEGIDIPHALRYYSRFRFINNLLPLLNASSYPRVIAILAGGMEVPLDLDDLELRKNFSGITAGGYGATQTSLSFELLAESNPNISYIHKYPGFVDTGTIKKMMATVKGILAIPAFIATWTLVPVLSFLLATSTDVAGERGLFLATSSRYPPAEVKQDLGVPLPKDVEVAKASIVTGGKRNGVYILGEKDDSAPDAPCMPGYRQDGTAKKIWEATEAVWDRALGRSA